MYSITSAVKVVARNTSLRRSFASVKNSKPFYRRIINKTTVGIASVGGILWYGYTRPYDKEAYIASLDNPTPYELETLTPQQVAAHKMLLTRTGSRLLGKVMSLNVPVNWRKPLYSYVSRLIGINTDEFAGTFEDYPTPNSFFTRNLKDGARPIIRCENLLLSPVDGTISIMEEHISPSVDVKLHQIKGVSYSLKEFLGKSVYLQNEDNNLYSAVIYLSPSNYHHIHSPVDVSISDRTHVPGALLPVKQSYVDSIKSLYTLNERVILSGHWRNGFFSIGLVGAYNVGSIRISNPHDVITTNLPHELHYRKYMRHMKYTQQWQPQQGDRIGTFELGSTIVLAFEAPQFIWLVQPGDKVKMGQPIGYVNYSEEVEEIIEMMYPEALEQAMNRMKTVVKEVKEIEEMERINEEIVEEVNESESMVEEVKEVEEVAECIEMPCAIDETAIVVEELEMMVVASAEVELIKINEEEWIIGRGRKDVDFW